MTTGRLLRITIGSRLELKRYLVDTGAGINIVKRSKIIYTSLKDVKKAFFMSNDKYETDEYVYLRICNKRNKFYAVADDFPLIEDGIIGLPMLENYQYKITNDQIQLNDHIFLFQSPQFLQDKPESKQFISTRDQRRYASAILVSNQYQFLMIPLIKLISNKFKNSRT